ncbi:RiPP maturation radical SAM C-methyltransferase [Streptomyces sp. NPDC058583]|uniref:RiPP maturation radical SAM C-methyltransferase n=1 Tax=unclassified Streptomyces TaxID=2593676 RepID=UPI003666891D
MTQYDVVLVSMPWAPPAEPTLGLGILSGCLSEAGIRSRVVHVAPHLLRWLKPGTYQYLANAWGLNEFVFTGELDPLLDEQQEKSVVDRILKYTQGNPPPEGYEDAAAVLELFLRVRHEVVPQLLDDVAERILAMSPRLVGFTCLFDQTMASLALATRLKARDPGLTVVFGGYALEGEPGRTVAQAFDVVDTLVQGDGEQIIVDLALAVLGGGDRASWPGHLADRIIRPPRFDLTRTPLPDYSDWFHDLDAIAAEHRLRIPTTVLPVEASRGCWWGQSQHCVFCGIDDETLKYRHRSAADTLRMLTTLRERHGETTYRFSDYIMPKDYYTDLLPELSEQRPKFSLHSEIKANHPPERVRALVDAGYVAVQPGIESFASPVLRSMRKGVRGIDNVSLLKAGYVHRLAIHYNILYGLPDDSLAVYQEMLGKLPALYHLAPPVARSETVVTRFAPLQTDPARFGLTQRAVHHECYDVLLSGAFLDKTGFSLDEYAYYFQRNFEYAPDLDLAYGQLRTQIDHWKKQHRERFVELSWTRVGTALVINDSRFDTDPHTYTLSHAASSLYQELDERPLNIGRITHGLVEAGALREEDAEGALAELLHRRLLWTEGDLAIGLAAPSSVAASHRTESWSRQWPSIWV